MGLNPNWYTSTVKFLSSRLSQSKTWLILFGLTGVVVSFQNCGGGFKTTQQTAGLSSNQAADNGTPAPAPAPAPVVNRAPALVAPTAASALAMNVASKVVVNAVDADTAFTNLTFILRSPPASGQVVLDPGTVLQNRGFTYTPNQNFIGTDTLVLSVMDPEGNMGPDQRFDIRVEQRGIGQMLGTWVKATCTPNTGPIVGTYVSTLTNFTMTETVYTVDCVTPILEHRMSGLHRTGLENVVSTNGVTGFEYDITNHQSTVRPLSAIAAQALNAQAYCGFTGWVANVTRDITLTGCNGLWASTNLFMLRRVEYPVGQPARLFYSEMAGGIGTSALTRSRGLALGTVFVKQP